MESQRDAVVRDFNKTDSDKRIQRGIKSFDGLGLERPGCEIKFSGTRSRIKYLVAGFVFLVVMSFIAGLFVGRLIPPSDVETDKELPRLQCLMNGRVMGRIALIHDVSTNTIRTKVEKETMLAGKASPIRMNLYLTNSSDLAKCSTLKPSDAEAFTPANDSTPARGKTSDPHMGQLAALGRNSNYYTSLAEIPAHLKVYMKSKDPQGYAGFEVLPTSRAAVHFSNELSTLKGKMLLMTSDQTPGDFSTCCILTDFPPKPFQ